ncbi:hypothetical protein G7074_19865 [Pedobacter sp. HDW13]|uniref:hypothetical protein n=1 Tax=Pedobacter sp. HDW13 TaxID=2714940 RepID=UPI00140CEBC0|nr:hypothetical protein [Pedobacter sp. HDW13]QIL41320.1 hypothetical protein G7074_19865 [Pedobacter sp. HDW13]
MKTEKFNNLITAGGFKQLAWLFASFLLLLSSGCVKVEYSKIDDPAYLRVFNNLNYVQTLGSKDNKVPFFCMLINPVVDGSGMPTSAEIVGDFLDQRDAYAPPYPSHIGTSTSVNNPEYPGKENVLVGPVLNGFDLSSWAQVPSGRIRIMFAYRPKNTVPFFQLENQLKKDILIDTTLNLTNKEVYTLHLLQKDFETKRAGILLREEIFQKLPLSDSLSYVNFYNMSAKGYWQADKSLKAEDYLMASFQSGMKDDMNVFLSLYENQNILSQTEATVPGFKGKYIANVKLNTATGMVNPYVSFPIWAGKTANGITTNMWQRFDFFVPGMDITNNPFYPNSIDNGGNWVSVNCLQNGKVKMASNDNAAILPNLLVNIHSGVNNPKTFATVNTIEVVNGRVYLTTIQRKYAPPIY